VNGRGTPYAIEGREDGQYCMTDKKDPQHLLAMAPAYLTGESLAADTPDRDRRAALARFMADSRNPWFARAYINRMWTALLGWGFFPSVNDISSMPPALYPEVLDLLAREWTTTGYDMRWLFRTIANSQTYQRHLQPRPVSLAQQPLAVCPNRLRPEQIFEELVKALGFNENDRNIPSPAVSSAPAVARHSGVRHMVYQAFKVDPSLPPEEIHGTIPQALLMMNSVLVNSFVACRSKSFLADALAKNVSDDDILLALYERTLARKPQAEEVGICKRYLKNVGDRKEAFEDIFWSLVNSTEFLSKK
jgi:hypothetical protein